jgi:hypothetical protein
MNCDVVFILNGQRKVEVYDCLNVGTAFAKCLKKNPDAKLISAHVYRKAAGECEMWLDYIPPSIVKVEPLPKEHLKQLDMNLE